MPITRRPDRTVIKYPAVIEVQDEDGTNVGEIYGYEGEFHAGEVSGGGGSGGTVTASRHGLGDLAIHTGTLDDNQGPQFLKVDGSRALTGNLPVNAGVTVDGVDISDHQARHESGGADAIDHDSLSGFVANEHINHTSVTLTAGNGLTGGGTIASSRSFAVGAGDGITVNADDVAVNEAFAFDWTGEHTHAADVRIDDAADVQQDGRAAESQTDDGVTAVSAAGLLVGWGTGAEALNERESYTLEDVHYLAERALSRTDAHLMDGELDVWRWAHAGGVTIAPWNATSDSTVTVANPDDAYEANLDIEGDITLGGTVDGVNLAEFNAAQFLALAANADMPNERVLDVQTDEGLAVLDNGAGGTYELRVHANAGLTFGGDGGIELDWTGTPVTITPGATTSAGSSAYAAHTDHRHAIAVAAPDADSVNVDASDPGDATSFSRSDHTHNLDESIAPTWTGAHTWATTTPAQFRDTALKVYSSADGQLDIDADTELELTAPTVQLVASTRVLVDGALDVDGDLEFQGAQSITTTADSLTLAPADDLALNPTGDVLTNSTIAADNWTSQTTGWGVSYAGAADFRSIYADELHVQAFIADIYQALVGGIIVTKSRGRLSRDFTIPADTATGTLYLEDLEGWEDTQVFAASDIVRLRFVDTSGGGLIVTDVWGVVSSYTDLTGGEQSWTFTTSDDGGVDGSTIYAGAIALDYGQSGTGSQGIWEATVLDAAGAPYSQVATWDTNPWTGGNWTTRVRLGNLDGLAGVGLEYGLFAGDGITDADSYLLITDAQAELHNLPFEIHDGASTVFAIDPTTPSLALGASVPTDYDAGDGVWMGLHSGAYKARIGDTDGERLEWTGSELYLYAGAGTYLRTNAGALAFYANSLHTINLDGATGDVRFGQEDADQFNWLFDASEGDALLRSNTTTLLGAYGSDGWLGFGSDLSDPSTTAMAVFADGQTYNGESVGAGDVLQGDNSDGEPNVFWDASAGTWALRVGTVTHIEATSAGVNIGQAGRPAYERTY